MYRVPESIRSAHGRDGAVVLDVRGGQMFNLNLVGSRIFELLKRGTSESAIADEIVRQFGVSRHLAESDLQTFLDALSKCRLIENVDEV
jgi:hypothetical protein